MILPLFEGGSVRREGQILTHNPFSLRDRSPFGAVPVGKDVTLSLTCWEDIPPEWVVLRLWHGEEERIPMAPVGENRYSCTVTLPERPCLLWYRFEVCIRGQMLYCRANPQVPGESVCTPVYSDEDSFQLTVYRESDLPAWAVGGMLYQIFPDRFCKGTDASVCTQDRFLREDWGQQPDWCKDDGDRKWIPADFFGGNLAGITEKLDYLASLGVTVLYLNPIFMSFSNHRYDTADYAKIDPVLGDTASFERLCREAHARGMRVILDGVFSHTGADSVYFNSNRRFPEPGAYNDPNSPYASWYTFRRWPDDYLSWWDFPALPNVNETNPAYLDFITGENGIARRWLRLGADGWRLDVADELPDEFLDRFYVAVKAEKPDAAVLLEVWEDASNKCSYGQPRRYLLGGQADSIMNYPLRERILALLDGTMTPETFCRDTAQQMSNYPWPVMNRLMNLLSTHDTPRITSLLGAGRSVETMDRARQAVFALTPEERERGRYFHRVAALISAMMPGMFGLYYGDEAAMEGLKDPFNRGTFPWNQPLPLADWYSALGRLRQSFPDCFAGPLTMHVTDRVLWLTRTGAGRCLTAAVNTGAEAVEIPLEGVVHLSLGWESPKLAPWGTVLFQREE